ncbi:MAG: hypothetical protein ACJAZX_001077 [Rickettsiales bacterium]|jgi:hypothetical protein
MNSSMQHYFKYLFKITLVILLTSAIFSCENRKGRMKAPIMAHQLDLEYASPDFKQGWKDGCESAMAGGNSFYQMFHKSNTQDGYKFTYSSDYRTAWSNSYWFCYRSDYIEQKSTPLRSFWGGAV